MSLTRKNPTGWLLGLCTAALLAGCGDDVDDALETDASAEVDAADAADAPQPDVSDAGPGDATTPDTSVDATAEPLVLDWTDHNDDCDPLDQGLCALPWPSNLYLEADANRVTGHTVSFGPTTLGANFQNKETDPEIYRRLDGFSVGTPLIVKFPNIDTSALPTEFEVDASIAEDADILWFEVTEQGLERVPYWVELDAWTDDPDEQVLWVRSGRILNEGTRYIVAMRGLVDTQGTLFEAAPAFEVLRGGDGALNPPLTERQGRFDTLLAELGEAGVDVSELQLAWDFNTASSEALHSRMLEMRSLALDAVGDEGAEITITEVQEFTPEEHNDWHLILRGTFRAPHFMREDNVETPSGPVEGWTFNTDETGAIVQNGWRDAPFWIGVPHSALDGSPHGLAQYGHGFFGNGDGTVGRWTNNGKIANDYGYIFFGGNWTGMAEEDFGRTQISVFDLNFFHWLPDRVHQGMIEFIVFARGMRERFPELEEVTSRGINIDQDDMVYTGISQGGINGATYMALSPDITRGHLGVPGANYGLLEHRSTNFSDFFVALGGAYRGRDRQAVLLSAIQLLWDTTDPISYYRHISVEPFEDDGPRAVLAAPSRGDRQVTTLSMEVIARSDVGLATMENYSPDRGIPLVDETPYPHTGSGLVLYDFGNPWPAPARNRPAEETDVNAHNLPRRSDLHNEQMVHFFRTGEIVDVCGGDGCTPD